MGDGGNYQLAFAPDFIMEMDQGYDSIVFMTSHQGYPARENPIYSS